MLRSFEAARIRQRFYWRGHAAGLLHKQAATPPQLNYRLAGRLIVTPQNWGLLEVPNALVRGVFDALDEPGIELPLRDGVLRAHITVFRPEDMAQIGGAAKLHERGHMFHYTLGPLKTVTPRTWAGVAKVWYITVTSPELQALRKSYGLTAKPHNNEHDFHITVAIRKTKVLQQNAVSKAAQVGRFLTRQELLQYRPAQPLPRRIPEPVRDHDWLRQQGRLAEFGQATGKLAALILGETDAA